MVRSLVRIVSAAALVAGFVLSTQAKAPALPFIENDFDRALAGAKSAARPLFVEVWAPW